MKKLFGLLVPLLLTCGSAFSDVNRHIPASWQENADSAKLFIYTIDANTITDSTAVAARTGGAVRNYDTTISLSLEDSSYFVQVEIWYPGADTSSSWIWGFERTPPTNWSGMGILATGEVGIDLDNTQGTLDASEIPRLAYFDTLIYIGENGLGIVIDSTAGNTNTVIGVDGTEKNPVSTLTAARTLALALGAQRFYIHGGSTFNGAGTDLDGDYSNWEFYGEGFGAELAFGGQLVTNAFFHNITLSGAMHPSGGDVHYVDCVLGFISSNYQGHAEFCELKDTIVTKPAADISFAHCYSGLSPDHTPTIDFGVGSNTIVMTSYSGGIRVMNGSGNDSIAVTTDGHVIISANNSNLRVMVHGMVNLTDSGTSTIITKEAVFDRSEGHLWVWGNNDTTTIDSSLLGEWLTTKGDTSIGGDERDAVLVILRDSLNAALDSLNALLDSIGFTPDPIDLNLVRNPGFERDSALADAAPSFWIKGAGNHTASEGVTSPFGGRWAFQMEAGIAGDTLFIYQPIGEVPAGHYYLSASVDNAIIAPAAEDAYIVLDNGVPTTTSAHIDSVRILLSQAQGQEAGKIVTLPAGELFIGLRTNAGPVANDTTRVIFDNIKLIPLGFDTAAYQGGASSLDTTQILAAIAGNPDLFDANSDGFNLVVNGGFDEDTTLYAASTDSIMGWKNGVGTHAQGGLLASDSGGRAQYNVRSSAVNDTVIVYQLLGSFPAGSVFWMSARMAFIAGTNAMLVLDDTVPTHENRGGAYLDSLVQTTLSNSMAINGKFVALTAAVDSLYIGLRITTATSGQSSRFDDVLFVPMHGFTTEILAAETWRNQDTLNVDSSDLGIWLVNNLSTPASGSGIQSIVIGATDTVNDHRVSGVPVTLRDATGFQIGQIQITNGDGYTTWGLTATDVVSVFTGSNIYNSHIFNTSVRTFIVGSTGDTVAAGHATTPTDTVLTGDDFTVPLPPSAAMATVSGVIHSGADTALARITVEISIRESNVFDTSTGVLIAPVAMKVRTLANGTWNMPLIRNEFFNKDISYVLNAYKGSKRYFTNREFRIPDGATTYVVTWP